ncbi:GH39 family glycosyl hydrolase [Coraliomargarita sp. W4R53]
MKVFEKIKWTCVTLSVAATALTAETIGQLDHFWRHRPVLDRWAVGGAGLTQIPNWLCDPALSFPYQKKEQGKEVPFADHLTVVRLLGGWNSDWKHGEVKAGTQVSDYDLAYRDEDGVIQYRWDLLAPRLDPYVNMGYDLTLVLDNTPACFADDASFGSYGPASPPDNLEEWGTFIEELCRQLVTTYGENRVDSWRFRMGTECQGRDRFDGTQEQFNQFYETTVMAVHRVLPNAAFGPFNLAGGYDGGPQQISYLELADYCIENGLPLDFAAVSIYSSPSVLRGVLRTADPRFKAQQKIDFWNALSEEHQELSNVSREVQEFGILGNEFKIGHEEPGARGAAWHFDVMVTLLENGLDRLWYWSVFDSIPHQGRRDFLMNGLGWLFSVMEYAAGGEAFVLEPSVISVNALPPELQELTSFEREEPLVRPGRLFVKSLAVVHPDRVYLITSVYNEDRFVCMPQNITLTLPVEWSANFKAIKQTALTRTNSTHWMLREDLDAAGLLDPDFAAVPGLLSPVIHMGGHAARLHVGENWESYENHMKGLLTLKPFEGEIKRVEDNVEVVFQAAPSSVTVIVIEK